jgi:hypothetical protein
MPKNASDCVLTHQTRVPCATGRMILSVSTFAAGLSNRMIIPFYVKTALLREYSDKISMLVRLHVSEFKFPAHPPKVFAINLPHWNPGARPVHLLTARYVARKLKSRELRKFLTGVP